MTGQYLEAVRIEREENQEIPDVLRDRYEITRMIEDEYARLLGQKEADTRFGNHVMAARHEYAGAVLSRLVDAIRQKPLPRNEAEAREAERAVTPAASEAK
jgi:hypothetical protein